MNTLAPTRLLRVAEDATSGADHVAVLGRDIRTSSERIARYCVVWHEPIYENLATLVESMAYWDRLIARKRASGWAQSNSLCLSTVSFDGQMSQQRCKRLPGS